mgnify:CR=1 FL=1
MENDSITVQMIRLHGGVLNIMDDHHMYELTEVGIGDIMVREVNTDDNHSDINLPHIIHASDRQDNEVYNILNI